MLPKGRVGVSFSTRPPYFSYFITRTTVDRHVEAAVLAEGIVTNNDAT